MSSALEELQELYNAEPDTERISLRSKHLEQIDVEMEYLQLHFAHIRHLDLSDNALETLPTDFGQLLPKLVALDLTKNQFRSIADVGEILQQCGSLKSLSVTLKSATEEKLLLVMLPKLRILNGTPLSSPASPPSDSPVKPIHALSTVLSSPSTASDSSVGVDFPTTSTAAAITSPQDKRTLRLQFANLKMEHQAAKEEERQQQQSAVQENTAANDVAALARTRRSKPTTSNAAAASKGKAKTSSVRPTEQLASISDDKTDWYKLLKSQKSQGGSHQHQADLPTGGKEPSQEKSRSFAVASTTTTRLAMAASTTETFLAQLKAVVKAFHQCDQKHSPDDKAASQQQLMVYEQLDRHVDLLASQLSRQENEPQKSTTSDETTASTTSSGDIERMRKSIAMLQTRWNLLEVCGLYGVEKANDVDGTLGSAFNQLLLMQKDVLVALQLQQAAIAAKTRSTAARTQEQSNSCSQLQQHQHQMKVLLEVAESLESDLEAVQTRLQQEKAQRELLEQENWSLKRENESFKRKQPRVVAATGGSDPVTERAAAPAFDVPTVVAARRIRKRTGDAVSVGLKPSSTANASPIVAPAAFSALHGESTTRIRNLTLKQLVDLIHCITASKQKYDTKCFEVGAPRETMEQHMYTYLNQRFGLHALIVDYASALWKACVQFAPQENDAAMFLALLKNSVDEGFVSVKKKLQQALVDLLRAYFQAKFPMKQEIAIASLVQNRLQHLIYEEEWHEMLTYLYDPQDSSTLLRLVRRKAEKLQEDQRPKKKHFGPPAVAAAKTKPSAVASSSVSLPFAVFEQVLYEYQLQGRRKLLEGFRTVFESYDTDRVGIVDHDSFAQIVRRIAPKKSDATIAKLLETLDPFHHDVVTFSDAASCLMPEIRAHHRSPTKATPLKPKTSEI